ncbi:hypothetical protein CONPUDRAFT_62128, partial [Coniophora puteana RWD-64-598 SS2]
AGISSASAFHQVEFWESNHWESSTTAQLGVTLCLGHGRNKCPETGVTGSSEPAEDIDCAPAEFNLGRPFKEFTASKQPPTSSKGGGHAETIIVVDKSGVYEFPVVWCTCTDKLPHKQLFDLRLYPASQTNPKTIFTFDVLDDLLVCNFEGKEAPHSYFRRLTRMTNEAFLDSVPVCNMCFLRLKTRKKHGHGYGDSKMEAAGASLATTCVACPHPGINLDNDWESKGLEWLYYGWAVVDGNFKQQSYTMRRPENNVPLTDSLGYTVNKANYQAHLATAKETPHKSTCNNHRAVSQAGQRRNHLAVTGLAALVCAQHGLWFASLVVDFLLGERQAYIDYALCIVLQQLRKHKRVYLFYDIVCQYLVKLQQWIKDSPHLTIPEHLKIIPAISEWLQRLVTAYAGHSDKVTANDAVFKVDIRKLPSRATTGLEVTQAKEELTGCLIRIIEEFLEDAPKYMGNLLIGAVTDKPYVVDIASGIMDSAEEGDEDGTDGIPYDPEDEEETNAALLEPETRTISLLSAFGCSTCLEHGLDKVIEAEMTLRTGQANNAVEKIRHHIGHQSLIWHKEVRESRGSQHQGGLARSKLDVQSAKVNLQRLYYNHARKAMLELKGPKDNITKYQVMTRQDLKASTAELRPDATGLRHEGLSWLWTLDVDTMLASPDGDTLLNECESGISPERLCTDACQLHGCTGQRPGAGLTGPWRS